MPTHLHRALLALVCAAFFSPLAARAGDSTPPVITHSPAHGVAGQPIKIGAHIVDESRIFPQIFFRYGTSGGYEAPLDLKKVKGVKDEYEATLPYKPGPIDYYLECYDEFGNGPARSGSPEAPLRVVEDASKLEAELPMPGSSAPASASAAAPAPSAAMPASEPPAQKAAPAAAPRASAEAKPIVTTRLVQPATPFTASEAAWHSAILPGRGQYRSERRIRGLAFGVATGASLVATLWLTVRAHQANTIYVNAPLSVRSQAYDQAVSYADARNTMLGVTIGLWAVNIAEAYLLHGTKDPW